MQDIQKRIAAVCILPPNFNSHGFCLVTLDGIVPSSNIQTWDLRIWDSPSNPTLMASLSPAPLFKQKFPTANRLFLFHNHISKIQLLPGNLKTSTYFIFFYKISECKCKEQTGKAPFLGRCITALNRNELFLLPWGSLRAGSCVVREGE